MKSILDSTNEQLLIKLPVTISELQLDLIEATLIYTKQNVTKAAKLLGTTRQTMYKKLIEIKVRNKFKGRMK